jgi:hypothetical protein
MKQREKRKRKEKKKERGSGADVSRCFKETTSFSFLFLCAQTS